MTTVNDILQLLLAWAPRHLAWERDNIGLLLGAAETPVHRVLVCLDVTPETVREAQQRHADLIVAHHPLIFHPLRTIRTDDVAGRMLVDLLGAGISVIAMHTNADAAEQGLNVALAARLGLENVHPLEAPRDADARTGLGAVGRLAAPMSHEAFLQHVRTALGCESVRFSNVDAPRRIATVAVCGGSGSGLISDAIRAGADAYVTADLTYHAFQDHRHALLLVDAGHYETEAVFVARCAEVLEQALVENTRKIDILRTDHAVNPVRFLF
jgi:dinuclear metal center YbgI/SA1388 family protein